MAVVHVTPEDVEQVREILDRKRDEARQEIREFAPTISDDHLEHVVRVWGILDHRGEAFLRGAVVARAVAEWRLASGDIDTSEYGKVMWDIHGKLDEVLPNRKTREDREAEERKLDAIVEAHPGIDVFFGKHMFKLFDGEEEILGPNPGHPVESVA